MRFSPWKKKEKEEKKTKVELTVSTMQCITSFCIDAGFRAAIWYETVDGLGRCRREGKIHKGGEKKRNGEENFPPTH